MEKDPYGNPPTHPYSHDMDSAYVALTEQKVLASSRGVSVSGVGSNEKSTSRFPDLPSSVHCCFYSDGINGKTIPVPVSAVPVAVPVGETVHHLVGEAKQAPGSIQIIVQG